jgi:hypothetical protein
MSQKEVQKDAAKLFFELLTEGFIKSEDDIVRPYLESQEVRDYIKVLADVSGVRVVKKDKFIHMMAKANGGVFSNNLSELRKHVKGYESKIDLYLMGLIWLVLFSEMDDEMAVKLDWENEGISYKTIEDGVTKVLNRWSEIDEEQDGAFSRDWSLAVKGMKGKWDVLQVMKSRKGQVSYGKRTKFGLIEAAMRELEKDRMVFLRHFATTAFITPTVAFYERLQIRFGELSPHVQGRYDMVKGLIDDIKSDELGA